MPYTQAASGRAAHNAVLALVGVVALWTAVHAQGARSAVSLFEIVPGRRFGPIAETTARAALPSLVAADAIRAGAIEIGEGVCSEGVRLFPATDDEVEVTWQDQAETRVAFVRASQRGGRWHTARGVRVGSLLTALERVSHRVLTFSGFGWDYGGIATWTEGRGTIGLQLGIDAADQSKAIAAAPPTICGDRIVRSDEPAIRALRIRVIAITQTWGQPLSTKDCR